MSAILVLGEPGTGKSAAIENLDPKTTVIITPNNKPLPFLGGQAKFSSALKNRFMFQTFKAVGDVLNEINTKAPHVKTIVIEDFTHYISKKVMDDSNTKGYEKWTELAVLAYNNIIDKAINSLRVDLDVILIAHVNAVSDAAGNMEVGLQTAGKLMDQAIKIPSYFTYILHAMVDFSGEEPVYMFQTNRDNVRMAKTSKGMFPFVIPNDYKAVLARIHSYEQGKIDENVVASAR